MSTTTPEHGGSTEPKLLFPALAPFYGWIRELSWPLVRLTVGGTLLVHGINKLMGPGVAAFASGSLAKRGIEPALLLAYVVFFLETVGAVMIMLGLFTRFFAAAIAIEFSLITFVAHWPNGYGWTNPRGGWEFPLLWGLIFLAIALRGGGPYSLDRKIGREL
jgi:putative oxidoreductase